MIARGTLAAPVDESHVNAAIERARQIAQRFVGIEGYVGCFLTGSFVYPGAGDAQSELDIAVLVADEAAPRLERRHHVVIDRGPPRRKEADVLVSAWSEQAHPGSGEWRHWTAGLARVVDDPSGRIAELLAHMAHVSEPFAIDRMKLHFLELHHCWVKERRMRERGELINAAYMVRMGAQAAVKTLAFLRRTWPPIPHWTVQGLRHAGVPAGVIDLLGAALVGPADEGLDAILDAVRGQLDAAGLAFHHELLALDAWWWSGDGQSIAKRWGLGLM